MGRLLLKFFVGGLAGIVVWMVLEPTAPHLSLIPSMKEQEAWSAFEMRLVMTLGAVIGMCVAGLDGYLQGGKIHTIRGAILGLVFGIFAAPAGYALGGTISETIFGSNAIGHGGASPVGIMARVTALTLLGALLGGGIGAASLNGKRALQGLTGGAIGAAIGAAVFDPIGTALQTTTLAMKGVHSGEVGTIPRAIFCLAMGSMIGLFIGLVELAARRAWVRLSLGRNEGKEWVIDAPQTFIGRSERAGIPLFGDPNVAPMHACIIRQGHGAYVLADGGAPGGTFLNGQPIQQSALFHGAQIRIGSFNLEFLMRHGAVPQRGAEVHPGQAYPLQGVQQQAPYPTPVPMQPMPTQAYPGQPMPTQAYPQHPMQTQAYPPQQTQAYPQQPMPTQAYPQSPMSGGGMALIATDGPLVGQRFPVPGPIEVGREATGIPVSFDTMASRRHASVAPGPMGMVVTDLGSTNGTYVNGQRVQSQTVRHGDLVKIGATTFRVEAV